MKTWVVFVDGKRVGDIKGDSGQLAIMLAEERWPQYEGKQIEVFEKGGRQNFLTPLLPAVEPHHG